MTQLFSAQRFSHAMFSHAMFARTIATRTIATRIALSFALGLLSLEAGVAAANASDLTVQVDNLRDQQGNLCVTLFASANAESFPNQSEKALQRQCVKITAASMPVVFKGISAGNYAVTILHDANANDKMDTGNFGMPTEGFGFSQNPPLGFAAPKFKDCTFEVKEPTTQIQIKATYF